MKTFWLKGKKNAGITLKVNTTSAKNMSQGTSVNTMNTMK